MPVFFYPWSAGMEDLQTLWADYKVNPTDNQLRDRLAERYFPWARDLAWKIACKMQLKDPDNAVGEVLKSLALTVIPNYDGSGDKGDFKAWAATCIKHSLINYLRKERSRTGVFHMFSLSMEDEDNGDTVADSLPSSPIPLYSDFSR